MKKIIKNFMNISMKTLHTNFMKYLNKTSHKKFHKICMKDYMKLPIYENVRGEEGGARGGKRGDV